MSIDMSQIHAFVRELKHLAMKLGKPIVIGPNLGRKIPGGKAEGMMPWDFDREQLFRGIEVEMEHTDDPAVAMEIAMDHLAEDGEYYTKLEKIHED